MKASRRVVGALVLTLALFLLLKALANQLTLVLVASDMTDSEIALTRLSLVGLGFAMSAAAGAATLRADSKYWTAIPLLAYMVLVSPGLLAQPVGWWKVSLMIIYISMISLGWTVLEIAKRAGRRESESPNR